MKFLKLLSILVILAVAGVFVAANFLFLRIELGGPAFAPSNTPSSATKAWCKKTSARAGTATYRCSTPGTSSTPRADHEFTTEQERKETKRIYSFLFLLPSLPRLHPGRRSRPGRTQIKDGYTVRLDVTVKYRVTPAKSTSSTKSSVPNFATRASFATRYKPFVMSSAPCSPSSFTTRRKAFENNRCDRRIEK